MLYTLATAGLIASASALTVAPRAGPVAMSAKTVGYAIPAVNVVTSCSINGCLEAAKANGGPMIIQFSRGGGQFFAGKAADNTDDAACIAGCVAGALHVRKVAALYGVPVILHTDHCMR